VTRLQLQDKANGEIILLDVSATPGKTVREPVKVVYDGEVATATSVVDQKVSGSGNSKGSVSQSEGAWFLPPVFHKNSMLPCRWC
jgi:hypothetical protein